MEDLFATLTTEVAQMEKEVLAAETVHAAKAKKLLDERKKEVNAKKADCSKVREGGQRARKRVANSRPQLSGKDKKACQRQFQKDLRRNTHEERLIAALKECGERKDDKERRQCAQEVCVEGSSLTCPLTRHARWPSSS